MPLLRFPGPPDALLPLSVRSPASPSPSYSASRWPPACPLQHGTRSCQKGSGCGGVSRSLSGHTHDKEEVIKRLTTKRPSDLTHIRLDGHSEGKTAKLRVGRAAGRKTTHVGVSSQPASQGLGLQQRQQGKKPNGKQALENDRPIEA